MNTKNILEYLLQYLTLFAIKEKIEKVYWDVTLSSVQGRLKKGGGTKNMEFHKI